MIKLDKHFFLSKKKNQRFKNRIYFGEYLFQYNDIKPVHYLKDNKEIILFGFAIDSHNSNRSMEKIAEYLVSPSILQLINKSRTLAGRFIIFYKDEKDELYVIPDATCSIQVSYTESKYELVLSSNPKIIADFLGIDESKVSRLIKSSAKEMHPLPYQLTMYDEIKVIIPNNYFRFSDRKLIRYYPNEKGKYITSCEAAKVSVDLLRNIIAGFIRHKKISIPLTSGVDSRVVLALSKDYIKDIPLYTIYHDHFTNNTADLIIPKEISNRFNLDYFHMESLTLPLEIYKYFKENLGSNYNSYIARNAYSYYMSKISKYSFLTGDILPLVKSSFGKNLPEFFANKKYLVTKTHNFSKANENEVLKWINDVTPFTKKSGISKFDLFFWEHRIGKWTSNNFLNYDLLTEPLNLFNCRELIEIWLNVPRKERMRNSIHLELIKLTWPELLDFPINPDKKLNFLNQNSYLFYMLSFVKFYLEKFTFYRSFPHGD